ncbi:transglycosylase domain-containing protein [Flexistipes sp.]|uniref:transglycosylase domain-containing protein n=1 Tax=Flexistipes sp. TaxID=3088135 RepID=UPI002E1CBF8C|nr:penicillin-binding transpeptidase domain-containing protein [Flexistipes sp.]
MKTKLLFAFILSSFLILAVYLLHESLHSYYVYKAKPLKQIVYNEKRENSRLQIRLYGGQLIYVKQFAFVNELRPDDIDTDLIHALNIVFSENGYKNIFAYYVDNYFPSLSAGWENDYLKKAALYYLNKSYAKKDLCLYYLNRIKFSDNIRGIGGLSLYLFNKKFGALDLKSKVYLLAYAVNFTENGARAFAGLSRQADSVLWQMFTNHIIDYGVYRKAVETVINFNVYRDFKNERYLPLVRKVEKELERKSVNYKSGMYKVKLTLKQDLNIALADKLNKYLEGKQAGLEAAYVLINYEKGSIEALYGTESFSYKYGLSRAWKMKRQTGSIFKPLVYVTAFETGVKPYDYIVDKQREYKIPSGIYSPDNYADYYMGKTYVRNGLVFSLNNATVKLALDTGLNNVAETAERFGLAPVKPYLSMPLGSNPFSVLDMAETYTAFANKGIKKDVSLIASITENGRRIDLRKNDIRVASKKSVSLTLQCMKDVVRFGTARKSGVLAGTAGKTGTTNDYKDAWFVGILEPYVLMVWMGFDDMHSMGEKGTGGDMAAPAVAKLQKYLYSEKQYTMKKQ